MKKLILFLLAFTLINRVTASDITTAFLSPSREARAQTWWHWMNNCVSPENMKTELEAMAQAGLGGVQLFNAGSSSNIPQEPETPFLSEAWRNAVRTTLTECARLNLDFTAQNGAGWSGTGGPWIAPSNGMLHVHCTERRVTAGVTAQITLREVETWSRRFPANGQRCYTDVCTLAFPLPAKCAAEEPGIIRSVTITWRGQEPGTAQLFISDDNKTWCPAASFSRGRILYRDKDEPVTYAVNTVRAKFHRVEGDKSFVSAQVSSRPQLTNLNGLTARQGISIATRETVQEEEGCAVSPRDIIVLTNVIDAAGTLTWRAPDDNHNWVLLRIGKVTNGHNNNPSPRSASGPVGDLLDARITQYHLQNYFQQILNEQQVIGTNVVKGLLLDSWESYTQNWAHDFPTEFARRRGYELWRYLPAYAGYLVKSRDATERFLFDVRHTLDELLRERYFSQIQTFCRAHGLQQIVEGFACGVGTFCGDPMTPCFECDIPMTEASEVTEPVSAAHLAGKPIVAYEAHTGKADWSIAPRNLKNNEDSRFLRGITRIVFHTYAHNSQPSRTAPGPAFGNYGVCMQLGQTWWPHARPWMDYLARCQSLLMRGRAANDILLYIGDDRTGKPDGLTTVPEGYAADLINGDYLVNHLDAASDGTLFTPHSGHYRLLVLRNVDTALSVRAARKLKELIAKGACVLGPRPCKSLGDLPNAAANDNKVKAIAREVWGECDGVTVKERTFGKGRVLCGMTLKEALAKLKLGPDFKASGKCEAIHRCEGTSDIYFVRRAQQFAAGTEMGFRVTDKRATILNPLTARIIPVTSWREENGYTYLPMIEGGAECATRFVIFEEAPRTASRGGNNEGTCLSAMPVVVPWQVSFANLGFTTNFTANALFDWAKHEDTNVRHYSGLATYRTTLAAPMPQAGTRYLLSLGRVEVSAEIRINGQCAGYCWCEPYELDITKFCNGQPLELEIIVANTWRNRLIADEALPPEQRATWTSRTNLTATDPLAPSGLLGPIQLISVR